MNKSNDIQGVGIDSSRLEVASTFNKLLNNLIALQLSIQPCFHNIYLRFDRLADSPIVGLAKLHNVNAFMICHLLVSACNRKARIFKNSFKNRRFQTKIKRRRKYFASSIYFKVQIFFLLLKKIFEKNE